MKTAVANELVIDSFAGGGGASIGIARALGRCPDIAINHSVEAIEMHRANHPATRHFREDVFRVNPLAATDGRPVGLLWASPDCKHFSRAKGGKPVSKKVRGLAWVVVTWAKLVCPRVIILENVREFEDWGPLVPCWACGKCEWKGTEGQVALARGGKRACPRCNSRRVAQTEEELPDPDRKGVTFRQFVGRLRGLGYAVQWKSLNAADYGAPTHRRRLFLVARNDGRPIAWPEPTHGDPKKIGRDLFSGDLKPWRAAAECIDWSIPCPSIFLTRDEAKAWGKANGCAPPQRPLAEATLKRIALGIKRYVLENPNPFIVTNTTGNPPSPVSDPLKTVTSRGNQFLCTPTIVPVRSHGGGGNGPGSVEDPLRTITCTKRGEFAVVAPIIAQLAHGEGSDGRGRGLRANEPTEPLGTIHAGGGNFAIIAPTLVQTGYGERDGQDPRCLDIESPLGTVVAGGAKHAVVAAFLAKHYGGVVGHTPDRPIGTVTAIDHHSVVAANLVHLNHGDKTCSAADEPMRAVVASGNHAALVYSFLMKYHGNGGQWSHPAAPLGTVDTTDRMGLVTVTIGGQSYAIVEIGMRMLRPMELALCQGFPRSVILTGTQGDQVERIGNSVSPDMAEAMVLANYSEDDA